MASRPSPGPAGAPGELGDAGGGVPVPRATGDGRRGAHRGGRRHRAAVLLRPLGPVRGRGVDEPERAAGRGDRAGQVRGGEVARRPLGRGRAPGLRAGRSQGRVGDRRRRRRRPHHPARARSPDAGQPARRHRTRPRRDARRGQRDPPRPRVVAGRARGAGRRPPRDRGRPGRPGRRPAVAGRPRPADQRPGRHQPRASGSPRAATSLTRCAASSAQTSPACSTPRPPPCPTRTPRWSSSTCPPCPATTPPWPSR